MFLFVLLILSQVVSIAFLKIEPYQPGSVVEIDCVVSGTSGNQIPLPDCLETGNKLSVTYGKDTLQQCTFTISPALFDHFRDQLSRHQDHLTVACLMPIKRNTLKMYPFSMALKVADSQSPQDSADVSKIEVNNFLLGVLAVDDTQHSIVGGSLFSLVNEFYAEIKPGAFFQLQIVTRWLAGSKGNASFNAYKGPNRLSTTAVVALCLLSAMIAVLLFHVFSSTRTLWEDPEHRPKSD